MFCGHCMDEPCSCDKNPSEQAVGVNRSTRVNQTSKFISHTRRLSTIKRCQTMPAVNRLSVAEHSYNVATMCMVISDELTGHPEFNHDISGLLRKALLHDVEESAAGDIPWHIKHVTEDTNKAISSAAMGWAIQFMPHELFFERQDCKQGTDGSLLNIVDMIEFCLWAADEMDLGNHTVTDRQGVAVNWLRQQVVTDLGAEFVRCSPTLDSLLDSIFSHWNARTIPTASKHKFRQDTVI